MKLNNSNVDKINNWLVTRFKNEIIVDEVYFIGSILTKEYNQINDVDIVQLIDYREITELKNHLRVIREIQQEFKLEFGKYLHITSFTNKEIIDFIEFMSTKKTLKIK